MIATTETSTMTKHKDATEKSGGDKNSATSQRTGDHHSTAAADHKTAGAAVVEKTADQHRADLNTAGQGQSQVVHSEDGKPFAPHHDDPAAAKPDPKDDPNSAMSVEGSVHGIGSDPSGNAAGPPGKPIDGFGDAAPGNAKAATTPLGGS